MTNIKNTVALALFACCTSVVAMEKGPPDHEVVEIEAMDTPHNQDLLPLFTYKSDLFRFVGGISPNNLYCTGCGLDGKTVCTVRPPNGTVLGKQLAHPARVTHACFAPIGYQLATAACDGVVRLWAVASGVLLASFPGFDMDNRKNCLIFSPSGRRLALTNRQRHRITVFKTDESRVPLVTHEINPIDGQGIFVDDDTFVYSYYDSSKYWSGTKIRLIGARDGTWKKEMHCGHSFIECLTQASQKPHIIAAIVRHKGDRIKLWDTSKKAPEQPQLRLPGVGCIALAPSANHLIATVDGNAPELRIFSLTTDLTQAELVRRWKNDTMLLSVALHWAHDGSSVMHVDQNSHVSVWKLERSMLTGKEEAATEQEQTDGIYGSCVLL